MRYSDEEKCPVVFVSITGLRGDWLNSVGQINLQLCWFLSLSTRLSITLTHFNPLAKMCIRLSFHSSFSCYSFSSLPTTCLLSTSPPLSSLHTLASCDTLHPSSFLSFCLGPPFCSLGEVNCNCFLPTESPETKMAPVKDYEANP